MALPRMNILSLEKLCRQAIKQQKKVETKLKMSALSHPLNQQVAQSVQQVTTLGTHHHFTKVKFDQQNLHTL